MSDTKAGYYHYNHRLTGNVNSGDTGAKDAGKGIDHGQPVHPASTYARVKIPAVGHDTRKTY